MGLHSRRATRLLPLLGAAVLCAAIGALDPGAAALSALYVPLAVAIALGQPRRPAALQVALICVLVLAPAAFGAGPGAARAPVDALSLLLAAVLAGGAREVWQGRRAQLGELAYQDPLTALLNARGLRDRLAYELARHGRHRRELAVLLFDLDGFKAVNDSYGHLEGDRLLRNVAAAMKSVARGQDTLARQGGDEFCVLAPETDRDGARVVAEKVSRAIASASGPSGRLSGSVGVAVYPGDGGTISELLDQADAALREAKRRRYEHRARRAA